MSRRVQRDITLDVALGHLPADTVLCLPKGLGNQDATIGGETTTVNVVVAQPNVGTGDCSEGGFVKATATSGTPPNPVNLLDKVCVKLGP